MAVGVALLLLPCLTVPVGSLTWTWTGTFLGRSSSSTTRGASSLSLSSSSSEPLTPDGRNWIERSTPTGVPGPRHRNRRHDRDRNDRGDPPSDEWKQDQDEPEILEYALGIDGDSFRLGPLSSRVYDALKEVALSSSQFPGDADTDTIPEELQSLYLEHAMTIAAREAVSQALGQCGLQLAPEEDEIDGSGDGDGNNNDATEDPTLSWGILDEIRLDGDNDKPKKAYETAMEAVIVGKWKPGRAFSFVARKVRAKQREVTLQDLMESIDPDGKMREKFQNDDSPPSTLRDLSVTNERRRDAAPRGARPRTGTSKDDDDDGGVRKPSEVVIPLRQILTSLDPNSNENDIVPILASLESRGFVVVDLNDVDVDVDIDKDVITPQILASLWEATEDFFDKTKDDDSNLPSMTLAEGAGSRHAVVGYASYDGGLLRFMEARTVRSKHDDESETRLPLPLPNPKMVPPALETVIGREGVNAIVKGHLGLTDLGRRVVTIALAASLQEAWASWGDDNDNNDWEKAKAMARTAVDELLDDGRSCPSASATKHKDDTEIVSMTPQRLCRYSFVPEQEPSSSSLPSKASFKEVFGAHVDTSFVTVIPVAAVPGLEVYDEDRESWACPEQVARCHYLSTLTSTSTATSTDLPTRWHANYVVLMTGELLEILSRGMLPCAVHRVVSTPTDNARYSAPVLLRARPHAVLDAVRLLDVSEDDDDNDNAYGAYPLLQWCDGMTMEEIHDGLQQRSS